MRRNEVRNITATLLSNVWKDVELELSLLTLNTMRKSAKTNDEVRLYICGRSFWVSVQKAILVIFVGIVFAPFNYTLPVALIISPCAITEVSEIPFKYLLFSQIHVLGFQL